MEEVFGDGGFDVDVEPGCEGCEEEAGVSIILWGSWVGP